MHKLIYCLMPRKEKNGIIYCYSTKYIYIITDHDEMVHVP